MIIPMRDLGYSNSWSTTPTIVEMCREVGHEPEMVTVRTCLTKHQCEECRYHYLSDSSD